MDHNTKPGHNRHGIKNGRGEGLGLEIKSGKANIGEKVESNQTLYMRVGEKA